MGMKRQYIEPKTSFRTINRTFLLMGSMNTSDDDADNSKPMLAPVWDDEEEDE